MTFLHRSFLNRPLKVVVLQSPFLMMNILHGSEACEHNLHARIIWLKGATPLTIFALRPKLTFMWKYLGLIMVKSRAKSPRKLLYKLLIAVNEI